MCVAAATNDGRVFVDRHFGDADFYDVRFLAEECHTFLVDHKADLAAIEDNTKLGKLLHLSNLHYPNFAGDFSENIR